MCGQAYSTDTISYCYYLSGTGTSADPYLIATAAQLKLFADIVNGGKTNVYAKLTANITLNDFDQSKFGYDQSGNLTYNGSTTISFEQWTPIGRLDALYIGNFDGNGYAVSGLYVSDTSAENVGLFGVISGGTVKNVGVVNSFIRGYRYVGSVCGRAFQGTVTNCYNTGTVSGTDNTGGVCGYAYNGTVITNCYNTGRVTSSLTAGGVCGVLPTGSTITSCYYLTGTADGGVGSGSGTYTITALTLAQMTGSKS